MVVPHLFLSYRTVDTGGAATKLHTDLEQVFKPEQVFLDRERVRPGEEFPQRLDQELARTTVMLVLIGRDWIAARDPVTDASCLDMPQDWVRREVERALASPSTTVIPLLIDGAERPTAQKLSNRPTLAKLATLNDLPLHKDHWQADLDELVAELKRHGLQPRVTEAPRASAPRELLAEYRDKVIAAHLNLIPFFGGLGDQLMEKVYVELQVAQDFAGDHEETEPADAAMRADRKDARLREHTLAARSSQPTPLRALLLEQGGDKPARIAVEGEPGAGKTTLARHLARTLAQEGKTPIFVALARHGTPTFDPFLAAARAATADEPSARDLAAALRARVAAGDVCVLLDGLDEVDPKDIDAVADRIVALAGSDLAQVPIAVLARPISLERRDLARFARARVQPLEPATRVQLARNLLQDDAPPFERDMLSQPALASLCRNPLMLTLAAMVARESLRTRQSMPLVRGRLYAEAIRILLERGHGLEPRGVKDPDLARTILRRLSLHLHELGGEGWDREAISDAVWKLREADGTLNFKFKETWGTDHAFRDDIGHNAGVFGPHDGVDEPWRYLHRSLREYLAAEELARLDEAALCKRIEAWQAEIVAKQDAENEALLQPAKSALPVGKPSQKPDPARWGEVYALGCGLVREPLAVLDAIRNVSPALALRTLPAVETLSARAGVEFLVETEDWSADDLAAVLASWRIPAKTAAVELLRAVSPALTTEQLAYLWFTLAQIGQPAERAAFFARAGRPIERVPQIDWVEVRDGEFTMGSPESEPERLSREGPVHRVCVPGFRLGKTVVTNAQYLAFDPAHEVEKWKGVSAKELGDHPVVNVSWWHAYLYCGWLGARLPSEAEWEYACRAGTTPPFSFGANVTSKQVNHNGKHPYAGGKKSDYRERTVAVGSLPANAWGLHEMHGNVWEWCEDTMHDTYEGAPADGSAWTVGGSRARVLRGGSWSAHAGWCRSAYRSAGPPGARTVLVGFRPASSSLTPFTPSPPP